MGWSGAQQELWAKQAVWEMGGMGKVAMAWEEVWEWENQWEEEWECKWEEVWSEEDHWEEMKGEEIQWEVGGSRARIWTSEEEGPMAGET